LWIMASMSNFATSGTSFTVRFGFSVSLVSFSSQIEPEQWRLLYSLNPAAG
jgi:hypothetical protein